MPQIDEIHQVGREMVHVVGQLSEHSGEYVCLIEGGGVCLGNTFAEWEIAERWLRRMFQRLFPEHRCDLGCISQPGAEFLADEEVLERLTGIERLRS